MAKTIEDALALYRSGKSTRECDKLTGINYKKIEREAKKRGVEKGDVSQLTSSMVRDKVEFVSLPVAVQEVVTNDVDERTKHIQILNKMTLKNLSFMNKKMDADFEMVEHKLFQETVNKAAEQLLGKEPQTVINNTNAQQNNKEITEIRRIIVMPDGH